MREGGAKVLQGTAATAVPAYRVHKAKNLGYVRLSGHVVYLGQAGSRESRERYRRVLAEWLATGRVPRRSPGSQEQQAAVTVTQLADGCLAWARTYYVDAEGRPSSGLGPVEAAAKALCGLYGATPAAAFGPVALRAVRQGMIDSGLCRNVVNQRVTCVKRIFRWGVAEEWVPPAVLTALTAVDPLRRGRSGARETEPVRPVPDAHVEAVLPFLPPTLQAMVRLQRLTGMRSGELCVLRTADVDRSGSVWVYRPKAHKTAYRGHERLIMIGPKGRAVLGPFLLPDRPDEYVFSPARATSERRGVLSGGRAHAKDHGRGPGWKAPTVGGRYQPRSYHRALRYAMRAATRAGVLAPADYWHPHQLRHRHATAVREARGLEAARVLLGHRTVDQTLEYAQAAEALACAVASELC